MLPKFRNYSFMPSFADTYFGNEIMKNLFENESKLVAPPVNIRESKDDFYIELAVPGLNKDDFRIDINNQMLTVSSEKREIKEESDEKILRQEFCFHQFSKTFSLPDSVDTEKISANHANGVIFIQIPKREESKKKGPRQISIE